MTSSVPEDVVDDPTHFEQIREDSWGGEQCLSVNRPRR